MNRLQVLREDHKTAWGRSRSRVPVYFIPSCRLGAANQRRLLRRTVAPSPHRLDQVVAGSVFAGMSHGALIAFLTAVRTHRLTPICTLKGRTRLDKLTCGIELNSGLGSSDTLLAPDVGLKRPVEGAEPLSGRRFTPAAQCQSPLNH